MFAYFNVVYLGYVKLYLVNDMPNYQVLAQPAIYHENPTIHNRIKVLYAYNNFEIVEFNSSKEKQVWKSTSLSTLTSTTQGTHPLWFKTSVVLLTFHTHSCNFMRMYVMQPHRAPNAPPNNTINSSTTQTQTQTHTNPLLLLQRLHAPTLVHLILYFIMEIICP